MMATYKSVPANLTNGTSKLPLRRTNSKPAGRITSPTAVFYSRPNSVDDSDRWRQKIDEVEEKRRNLLTENERVRRSNHDLERKYTTLQVKHNELETELFEKNENLTKLTIASKSLYKDYDELKNKYEVETSAMNKALLDASQWYKENKELRRRTLLLDTDYVDEGVDSDSRSTDSDLENLKDSVKNLSQEVAHLQAELNATKLSEFEATEVNMQLTQDLEDERKRNEKLQQEISELRRSHEQMIRVSNMLTRELEDVRERVKLQKDNENILRKEADDYKKERNVLAHRSTILMQGLNNDDGLDTLLLMQEIEDLKSTVEDERNKHAAEVEKMQERIEELENTSEVEVLDERIKLIESELDSALRRAEKAELALTAPPPPPPPPPMLLPPAEPPLPPLRIKRRKSPPPEDSGESTAIDSNKKPAAVNGVNEDIINQIKGGNFTLRKAKNSSSKKERETPKAVSEMLNILGSLRRTARNRPALRPAANMVCIEI